MLVARNVILKRPIQIDHDLCLNVIQAGELSNQPNHSEFLLSLSEEKVFVIIENKGTTSYVLSEGKQKLYVVIRFVRVTAVSPLMHSTHMWLV